MKEIKLNDGKYYFLCVDTNHTCYDFLDDIIDEMRSFVFEEVEDMISTYGFDNAEELRLALQEAMENEVEDYVDDNFYDSDDFEYITEFLGLDFPDFEDDEDYDEDYLKEQLAYRLINSIFVEVKLSPIQEQEK